MKTIYQNIFLILLAIVYILYFLVLLGFGNNNRYLIDTIQFTLKVYISIYLIVMYNPFVKSTFTETDKRIVFSCALFLLSTITITEFYYNYNNSMYYLKKLKFF
jgi:hypothetical protein|tara:strand:+ start:340 stop:651 length:312 start_codon:yes stop_codon:yes gene_type:complete